LASNSCSCHCKKEKTTWKRRGKRGRGDGRGRWVPPYLQELNDRSVSRTERRVKGNLHSIQEIPDVYWLKDRPGEEYPTTYIGYPVSA
jgi:hypothetical protein